MRTATTTIIATQIKQILKFREPAKSKHLTKSNKNKDKDYN